MSKESESRGFLEKLTASMFEETIKHVATKVWEERFRTSEVVNAYQAREVVAKVCVELAAQAFREDEALKAKLKVKVVEEIERLLAK